jgi:uracil-DNA glycosylase family 4
MMDERFKKIADFLRGYLDIYGSTVFVNEKKILQEIPQYSPPVDTEIESAETSTPVEKTFAIEDKPATGLWKFMQQIKDCTKCPLGHTRNRFVFGDGSETADILFIGEAPGAEEDRTGIPFVGRAGQLLNKLLSHIKVDRKDVFIANILKCRPPNNRDPQPAEVKECLPYLHKQIELIQPKVIVSLGRIAAQNLLNTTLALKQMRGRLWQYRGVTMIVTYHTAAVLRNMGLLDSAIEDFKFIYKTYQEVSQRQK